MKQYIIQHLPAKLFLLLKSYGWYGNFSTWQDAKSLSVGYEASNILEKVRNALLKVKNKEAVYERDSVIFDEVSHSWELLSALMWIAAQYRGELNIIDFGGSLGSTYYQNKSFLDKLAKVRWNIVEQKNFVEEGIASFQSELLKFYLTVDDCLKESKAPVNVILFSSVLQYLEDPYGLLDDILSYNIEYILIDRTGFTLNNTDRITVQKVHPKIYEATYPCRFFDEQRFLSFFKRYEYELILDFYSLDKVNIPSKYKGFLFRKNI